MKTEYEQELASICKQVFGDLVNVELTRPDEQFGDFSTNVAMQIAGKLGRNPREIAEQIVEKLKENPEFADVKVAAPGFINISLSDEKLLAALDFASELPTPLKNHTVVAEYSDANAFKSLHAGHLYTSLVGDAVANILQAAGGDVKRVNFGGDIGLHVGKAMWAIIKKLGGENPEKLNYISDSEKAEWVTNRYVEGNQAYKDDEVSKSEIISVNKRVYDVHSSNDKTSPFAQIYWKCRQWSYDGFDALYERLGMHPFDKYYPESAVWQLGLKTVLDHVGKVYEKSDGAVIFRGENHGLFTQVFINSDGLPTYAGKDVGLIQQKYSDYGYDLSYIITDVAQKDHLSVVMKSIEQFEPDLVAKTVHHTHGRVVFADGRKMSSREGNIVMAHDVIDAAKQAASTEDPDIVLGAIRYSFLKNRIGGDIAYDPEESVAQEGNSGPYLQYALVRARSILRNLDIKNETPADGLKLDEYERSLVRKLTMYSESFDAALREYSPHHICNYLYELAQVFNRFYEKAHVTGDPREALRANLVKKYEMVLAHGLNMLGMPQPEKM